MLCKLEPNLPQSQLKLNEIKAKEEALRKERIALEAESARKNISCDINSESIVSLFSAVHNCDTRTVLICKVSQQVKTVEKVKTVDDTLVDQIKWQWKETENALVLVDNIMVTLVVSVTKDLNMETFGLFLMTKYAEKHYLMANTTDSYSHLETEENTRIMNLLKRVDQQNHDDYKKYQQYRKTQDNADDDSNNSTYNYGKINKNESDLIDSRLSLMKNIRFIRDIKQFNAVGKMFKNDNQFKVTFDNHAILLFFLRLFRSYPQLINHKRYQFRVLDPIKTSDLFEGTNDQYFEKQLNHLKNCNFYQNLSFKNKVHQTTGLLSPGVSSFPGYNNGLSNYDSKLEIMKQESKMDAKDKYLPVFRYNKYFMDLSAMMKETTIYRVDYNERIVRVSDRTIKDEKLRASLTAKKKPEKSESSIAFIREEHEKQRMKRNQSRITSFYHVKDEIPFISNMAGNDNGGGGGGDDNPGPTKKIKLGD